MTVVRKIVEGRRDVADRLAEFGLVPEQLLAVAKVARAWSDDASPLMPANAPGTLAYIFGVQELRQQVVGRDWVGDRTHGIEAVINRALGIRIAYQNVDQAGDVHFPPSPRSSKGSASESLCGVPLFDHAGVDVGPLTGVLPDGIPTYYVMVGEDGSVELSHPVISDGSYKEFHERILISGPAVDWEDDIDDAPLGDDEFDVVVKFKEV